MRAVPVQFWPAWRQREGEGGEGNRGQERGEVREEVWGPAKQHRRQPKSISEKWSVTDFMIRRPLLALSFKFRVTEL